MKKLTIAFWVFIVVVLLYQAYNYNSGVEQEDAAAPKDQHFFFYKTNSVVTVAPPRATADVQQTHYESRENVPGAGSTTCYVTLTNEGRSKATDVQVLVRPFKGASNYDEDVGISANGPISDNDPLAQLGQWVTFPDLAPGESSTQTAVFLSHHFVLPGKNEKPQIIFHSAPAQPPANNAAAR